MPEVCGKDCCCEIGIFECCVVMICGVVVTSATCGAGLPIGRRRLAK